MRDDADAARVITCINALAGIEDPAALVESHGELLEFAREKVIAPDWTPSLDEMIARAEALRP